MTFSERVLEGLRRAAPFTTAALVLALAYLGWQVGSRYIGREKAQSARADALRGLEAYTGTNHKILQFYASPAKIQEGEKAILCYGVNNATSATIEPGPGPVHPSLNRCIDIAPEATTRYTLSAAGEAGNTVAASFVLEVTPDREKLPKILYFTRGRKQVEGDRTIFSLCFDTRNGAEVRVEPRAFPPGPMVQGCFYAAPQATTTYKLTVTDAKGRKAERKLVVEVP